MQLKRTYKRDKVTGKLVETTPENVKALLKSMPKRKRRSGAPMIAPSFKPILSDSMSVRPKKRKSTMKMLEAAGVPTHIAEDGRLEFRSRKHRNEVMKFYYDKIGFVDRSGGYGDFTGK